MSSVFDEGMADEIMRGTEFYYWGFHLWPGYPPDSNLYTGVVQKVYQRRPDTRMWFADVYDAAHGTWHAIWLGANKYGMFPTDVIDLDIRPSYFTTNVGPTDTIESWINRELDYDPTMTTTSELLDTIRYATVLGLAMGSLTILLGIIILYRLLT